jgi:FtsP/CotA-like multicopper oxidase with cupredoxin domain
MSISRRDLFVTGAAIGGAAVLAKTAAAQHDHHHPQPTPAPAPAPSPKPAPSSKPAPKPTPSSKPAPSPRAAGGLVDTGSVITPNGARLPWRVVGGVKVFHLVAEPVEHEFAPGLRATCWGYNGRTPGPTIEVTEGDRCRFYVTNKLPEPTAVHWHGLFVPNGMDGVAGLTQKPIPVGATFRYDFVPDRAGTFMYHPHYDEMTQIALGMTGMIVVHPRRPRRRPARDYALMLHEWNLPAGTRRPDPLAMNEFNLLTFNSKAFPATAPLVAEKGDLVRLRFGNLGPMDHHPIHIHGHAFQVTETDGGPVPAGAQVPETAVLVPVGTVRVVEFIADNPGDWPLHCHMTHHVMTQMGHDTPNFTGADVARADAKMAKVVPGYMSMGQTGMGEMGAMGMPVPANSTPMKGGPGPFGYIDMGGMFTIIKVRDRLTGDGDPGWYQHPDGTVARAATAAELAADGITV